MKRCFHLLFIVVCLLVVLFSSVNALGAPGEKEVLTAMRKATDFMVNEVSYRGGYLWNYTADLSRGWGEATARLTQIEMHQYGTPYVGEMYLDTYMVTGDEYYLECVEKAANAIIWGQHPLGGWHYIVDFDMTGIKQWYEEEASTFTWGMEEYRHFYGNCSYDDDATQAPTRFLMKLYMTTLNPAYREPLLKALNFFLISQYPNGAWPQRYPLSYEFVHDGLADYTSYYTFNDNVMGNNIDILWAAWEQLGNEEYKKAAVRGMNFYLISQGSEEQAGWGAQHGMDMKPAWGRTHEHAGYSPSYTIMNLRALMKFYTMTGDERYLSPIPKAIAWLRNSAHEIDSEGKLMLSPLYEVGTNSPIFMKKEDVNKEGYGTYTWPNEPTEDQAYRGYNIEPIEREYNRLKALASEEALAEYRSRKEKKPAVRKVDSSQVEEFIKSMDERGAWVHDVRVYLDTKNDRGYPWANDHIQGISTNTYVQNMRTFLDYLRGLK